MKGIMRYTRLFTALVAIAALGLLSAAPASANHITLDCNAKQVPVDPENTPVTPRSCDLTNPSLDWHFVITNVSGACPLQNSDITLDFLNCGQKAAFFTQKVGNVCHYSFSDPACASDILLQAGYDRDPNGTGLDKNCPSGKQQFNVSHRPCAILSEVLVPGHNSCNPATNTRGAGWEYGILPEEITDRYAKDGVLSSTCPVVADEYGPTNLTRLLGHEHLQDSDLPRTVQDIAYVSGATATGSGWMRFYLYDNDDECKAHNKEGSNLIDGTDIQAISSSKVLATAYTIQSLGTGEFGYVACLVSNDDTDPNKPAEDLVCGRCEHWPVEAGVCGDTAYGRYAAQNTCFTNILGLRGNNWGWTNGQSQIVVSTTPYTFDLWAGAAQCDTTRGTLVGSVDVLYDGSLANGYSAVVTYNMSSGFTVKRIHAWASSGTQSYPTSPIAPGLFTEHGGCNSFTSNTCTIQNLDGNPIWVIAHAEVEGAALCK